MEKGQKRTRKNCRPTFDIYVNVKYYQNMSTINPMIESTKSPPDLPTDDSQEFEISIGELAQELKISTRTIRYYEERQMLHPQRSSGGQRIYSRKDRGRLKLILRAKQAGLDLEEAKEVLDLYDILPKEQAEPAQAQRMLEMIQQKLSDINERLSELSEMKELLLSMEKGMLEMAAQYKQNR